MYYYNLYQHRRARRNKERSCKAIASGQSSFTPIHWICFILICVSLVILSLFRLYSYYLRSNSDGNTIMHHFYAQSLSSKATHHSHSQYDNIHSNSNSNSDNNNNINNNNRLMMPLSVGQIAHSSAQSDQSMSQRVSQSMNKLYTNDISSQSNAAAILSPQSNTNPNPINILESNLLKSAPNGNFHHRSLHRSLRVDHDHETRSEQLELEKNKIGDSENINENWIKLNSKQELLYGLAKGLTILTSDTNTWSNETFDLNHKNNGTNKNKKIEENENENENEYLDWQCNTSENEIINELESKYLKMFYMIGVEGTGHHLWKELFRHWTEFRPTLKRGETDDNANANANDNMSHIYFESYDDKSPLTTCLHTCFAWDTWQSNEIDHPWILQRLQTILNSLNGTNQNDNENDNYNENYNDNYNEKQNNSEQESHRGLLSPRHAKLDMAAQRAREIENRHARGRHAPVGRDVNHNDNNDGHGSNHQTIHSSRLHRSRNEANAELKEMEREYDILYKDVQWQQPGCQCIKHELLCNYSLSLKNNSILVPKFYSYPYFAHKITRVPNIVQLLQYSRFRFNIGDNNAELSGVVENLDTNIHSNNSSITNSSSLKRLYHTLQKQQQASGEEFKLKYNLKSFTFMYHPKIIVMYREYVEIIVSNCIHRRLHRNGINMANNYNRNEEQNKKKEVTPQYVKKCISFYPTIITLIQSQLLAIDPMYWIMLDYKDFVLRSVEYSGILSKFLEIDEEIVRYGLKFGVRASKTSKKNSAWNELYNISPELVTIVKHTFYQPQSSQWPIFNKKFIVTPENTWFLDVKYKLNT